MAINIRVAANGDDCCIRSSGSIYLNSIAIGADAFSYRGGFRFLNVTIPSGSVINTAYLTLTAGAAGSNDTVRLKLKGEQNNNAAGFSTYADFTGRTETAAGVDWDFTTDWVVDTEYNSADIKTVIQELVDDYGGLSAANIVIFADDDSSDANALRNPYDYNTSTTKCALLHIEYTLTQSVGGSLSASNITGALGRQVNANVGGVFSAANIAGGVKQQINAIVGGVFSAAKIAGSLSPDYKFYQTVGGVVTSAGSIVTKLLINVGGSITPVGAAVAGWLTNFVLKLSAKGYRRLQQTAERYRRIITREK